MTQPANSRASRADVLHRGSLDHWLFAREPNQSLLPSERDLEAKHTSLGAHHGRHAEYDKLNITTN